MRKNIFLSALLCLGFWLKATTLESSTKRAVRIDNDHIHTYNEKQGRWILPGEFRSSVSTYLKEFESSEEEFRLLNRFKIGEPVFANRPLFFPFGEGFTKKLIEEGKGRDIIISDFRDFIWPVGSTKAVISSKIGHRKHSMHTGIDITCPMRSPILASSDGVVILSGFSGNYGLAVQIKHEFNQLHTLYAHNSVLLVREGDQVKKGQIIALSGSTGHSTGPHLHFEVRYQNIVLNPEHYLLSPTHEPDSRFTVLKEEKL
jgi:hypothetical protein